MQSLKYKIIKSRAQYASYCAQLQELVMSGAVGRDVQDEIELLTLLIEKWDTEHATLGKVDPVRLLKSLMADRHMKPRDLVAFLEVSKSYVSEILNYKKGFSKDVIRKLAAHFKVSQEAFNREYELKTAGNTGAKRPDARMIKKQKQTAA